MVSSSIDIVECCSTIYGSIVICSGVCVVFCKSDMSRVEWICNFVARGHAWAGGEWLEVQGYCTQAVLCS